MNGDEIVGADEEVDVVRPEIVLLGPEVDPVQDDVEVAGILLDLRELQRASRVVHRKRVELEGIHQKGELGVGRLRQVDPEHDGGGGTEPCRLDPLRLGKQLLERRAAAPFEQLLLDGSQLILQLPLSRRSFLGHRQIFRPLAAGLLAARVQAGL